MSVDPERAGGHAAADAARRLSRLPPRVKAGAFVPVEVINERQRVLARERAQPRRAPGLSAPAHRARRARPRKRRRRTRPPLPSPPRGRAAAPAPGPEPLHRPPPGPCSKRRGPTYSVVREVGIRLRDTGAVGSCVELNAFRCNQRPWILGWPEPKGWGGRGRPKPFFRALRAPAKGRPVCLLRAHRITSPSRAKLRPPQLPELSLSLLPGWAGSPFGMRALSSSPPAPGYCPSACRG